MIERVETEFPRARYDDVHASLWAIHAAQARSLRQQAPAELTGREILSLSCEKGGSSVLADLYLVAGSATEEEERFAFGYGVFLQLLDDLQDVSHDLAAGHETLFTRAARCGVLDEPATRLARFMYDVLEAWPRPAHAQASDCRDLIRRNCVSLLVGAVADQPQRFSRGFRRAVFGQWPFSWRALRRLRRRAEQRFGKAAKALERATGSDSLLEWALEVD
jgi:hypothetical protein